MSEEVFKHYAKWAEYGRLDQNNFDKKLDVGITL